VTRHAVAELAELPGDDSLVATDLALDGNVTLIVRGPQKVQARRRGGRRARQGVTPLFSSRSRRGERSGDR
jgi:hypothetical protein